MSTPHKQPIFPFDYSRIDYCLSDKEMPERKFQEKNYQQAQLANLCLHTRGASEILCIWHPFLPGASQLLLLLYPAYYSHSPLTHTAPPASTSQPPSPSTTGTKQPQERVSSISTVLFYTSHMSSRPLTLISLHSFSLQLYGLGVTCPLEARDRVSPLGSVSPPVTRSALGARSGAVCGAELDVWVPTRPGRTEGTQKFRGDRLGYEQAFR